MLVKVQLVLEDEHSHKSTVHEVAQFKRECLSPDSLGLKLDETKELLKGIQTHLSEAQVNEYHQQQRACPHCQKQRRVKERRPLIYHSLFGKLRLERERLYHCDCQEHDSKSFSPLAELLPERNAPELLYLESKFAALMSYGLSIKLLSEVLPMDKHLNATTVRNHTHKVAERLESELGEEQFMFIDGCPAQWAELPRPDMPLTVGIDGGYVHSCEPKAEKKNPTRWFEVITGKSIADDGSSKCFGLDQRGHLDRNTRSWRNSISSIAESLILSVTSGVCISGFDGKLQL